MKSCQAQDFKIENLSTMNDFKKDILIGALFIVGVWSFISGLFVISTVLFAVTSIFSNMSTKALLNS
ncbi:hypothetical protein JWZ98_00515 [Methylomonas sp. EFPC1]|uniref:hypothetical protein n=1 Tax=Methylomonas sp. EFPC1 TaxID=2812647 RepID=UPI0019683BB9|nr:hypothetical protein [Methylomonas sp. EFPC1]QSB03761.1 hypothetical protein JWZ98_00515 [Methylomonas sp. EFPC1]